MWLSIYYYMFISNLFSTRVDILEKQRLIYPHPEWIFIVNVIAIKKHVHCSTEGEPPAQYCKNVTVLSENSRVSYC